MFDEFLKYFSHKNQFDVHHQDTRGKSVLHMAAIRQNEKVLQLLINMGADINALDNEGYSPLGLAIRESKDNQDKEAANLLLK
jgi:ankyrin repeat protein